MMDKLPISRRNFLGLSALGLGAMLAACGGTAAAPASSGAGPARPSGELVLGLRFSPKDADPATMSEDRNLVYAIFDPLIEIDAHGQLVPGLATSWSNPDPQTYLLKLRQGVKFHDGTEFDAGAVKAHFDRVLADATHSPAKSDLEALKQATVVDPSTLKLELKRPAAELLAALTDRAGLIPSPTAVAKAGKDFARHPVGAGPFKFVDWVQDDHVSLAAFDGYWQQGQPRAAKLTLRTIADDSVKLVQLKGGTIQLDDWVPYQEVAQLQQSKEVQTAQVDGFRGTTFNLNIKMAPFDRKEIRQAIATAIDRDAIHKAVAFGLGQVAQGPIPPNSPYFNPNLKVFSYSVEAAKAKLRDGGMPNGFSFTLDLYNDPIYSQYAQVIKANLEQIGVVANIKVGDRNAVLDRVRKGDYQASMAGGTWKPDPDSILYQLVQSKGSNNLTNYSNPQVDDLLQQGRATYDVAKRKDIYHRLEQIVVEDVARVWIHQDAQIQGLSPKVTGYQALPDGYFHLAGTGLN